MQCSSGCVRDFTPVNFSLRWILKWGRPWRNSNFSSFENPICFHCWHDLTRPEKSRATAATLLSVKNILRTLLNGSCFDKKLRWCFRLKSQRRATRGQWKNTEMFVGSLLASSCRETSLHTMRETSVCWIWIILSDVYAISEHSFVVC